MAVLAQAQRSSTAMGGLLARSCPTRVRLRVWGFTADDAALAESMARQVPGASFWQIEDVIATSGGACPIPSSDPIALRQGADYDWAWAAYLAASDAG